MVDQAEYQMQIEGASQPPEASNGSAPAEPMPAQEKESAVAPDAVEALPVAEAVTEEEGGAEVPQPVEAVTGTASVTEQGATAEIPRDVEAMPVATAAREEQGTAEAAQPAAAATGTAEASEDKATAAAPQDVEQPVEAARPRAARSGQAAAPADRPPAQHHRSEGRRRERRNRLPDIERPKIVKTLAVGQELEGKVKRLSEFGAFVDIGVGRDGLVHVSEMRVGRVNRPSDVVKEGDTVRVWIRELDRDKNRISLTMIPPGSKRISDLNEGDIVMGKVTRLAPYGAFVDIGVGRDGMLHVREMAQGFVNRPEDVVQIDQDLEVRIAALDKKRQRIDLSLKGLRPEEQATEAQPEAVAQEETPRAAVPAVADSEERRDGGRGDRRERDRNGGERRESREGREEVRREPRAIRPAEGRSRSPRPELGEREARRNRRGNRHPDQDAVAEYEALEEAAGDSGPTAFEFAMERARALAEGGRQQRRDRRKGRDDEHQSEQDDIIVRTLEQRQRA